MIYTFKSAASGNVIMLEPTGRRVLEIIGKDSGPKGIILPEQMPAAVAALRAAVAGEDAAREQSAKQPQGDPEATLRGDEISLRQRTTSFIDMLERSHSAGKEIVWGV